MQNHIYPIARIGFGLVLVLFFLFNPSSSFADTFLIVWNLNQEPDIAGYEVHMGRMPRTYDHHVDVGLSTDYFVSELPDTGMYYFAITAYDSASNKSVYSNEVSIKIDTTMTEVKGLLFHLFRCYPNPFNPETNIIFTVNKTTHVALSIHDVTGRLIKTLLSEQKSAGGYQIKWDGTDQSGNMVSNGVYLSRLSVGRYHQSRKLILIR